MVPVRRHVQHPLDLEVELMIGDPARRSQVQEVPQPEVRGPGPHRVGSNPSTVSGIVLAILSLSRAIARRIWTYDNKYIASIRTILYVAGGDSLGFRKVSKRPSLFEQAEAKPKQA